MNFQSSINMITVASQPSLISTQAVGAVLLHQFARDRFIEAGIDEELIHEAESMENLERMTANLFQENQDAKVVDINNSSRLSVLDDSKLDINSTDFLQNSLNDNQDIVDQYHSIAGTIKGNDDTIYHSINAGHDTSCLGRLESAPIMASYGRELRRIAEEFEKSRMRQTVKARAKQVQLTDINKENFFQLLEELFQNGVTRERIVILFFFCTDVAVRAASFAQDLVVKLMGWSFSYIINTVCKIVHELGGWDNVLFRKLPSLLFTCCAALGICALAVYLRKNLRA